jgi:6-phosphofructokinase
MTGSPPSREGTRARGALPISADIAALTEIGLEAVAAIESERAQAMVEWCRPTTGNRRLPLGMADLNVAGRRIDSDLDRRGQLPQAEIAQSNVGYYAGPRKPAF